MKRIFPILFVFMFAFALTAGAETVRMGGKNITYTVPAEMTDTKAPEYKEFVDTVRKGLGNDVKLDSIYVPEALDKDLRKNGSGQVSEYLVLCYVSALEKHKATPSDFSQLKQAMVKNFGSSVPANMKDELNKRFDNIGMGSVQIGNIKPLGTTDISKTAFACMFLVTQQITEDGKPTVMDMMIVSTQALVNERIVTVNQYKVVRKPDEVTAFKDKALNNFKQMALGK